MTDADRRPFKILNPIPKLISMLPCELLCLNLSDFLLAWSPRVPLTMSLLYFTGSRP